MFFHREQEGRMNSAEKLIYILKRLGEPPYEMGITELAHEMQVSKSCIHKIVTTLVEENLIVQNPTSKKYFLGPMLFRLGSVYSDLKGIWDIAKPVIKRLAVSTKQSVYIGIWDGTQAFMAYKIDGSSDFTLFKGLTGKKTQIHAGVAGKVLGAYQDIALINKLLDEEELEPKTPRTIVTREGILNEYRRIREQGYGISDEEHTVGVFGIGVPILDKNGKVWSCLCLGGRKAFFSEENTHLWIHNLKDGAEEISYRLGFRR